MECVETWSGVLKHVQEGFLQCSARTADIPGDHVAFSVGDHLVYSHWQAQDVTILLGDLFVWIVRLCRGNI